ncbi:hypothetical protein GA0074695_4145 [Micromonospora viridifaciens]|uniref:Uncharacterized protein n=1 Tax=Micromonospora viridifaciens TaxID=1881 RepID=A0A1C4YDI2_MICVI|nr:hypothetical protein GA0074695_4145 [Micromonospora viridifaciens]
MGEVASGADDVADLPFASIWITEMVRRQHDK